MIHRATAGLTVLALVAFASNSLLTRAALGAPGIDAATFTALRLGAGAVALSLIARAQNGAWPRIDGGGATGPLMLFAYALPFSFAYLRIGAALGALILFGAVQLTMIGYGLVRGERPTRAAWVGIALAAAGMAILTMPSARRPDLLGFLLMAIAGAAWGVYSIAGKTGAEPLGSNARSFLWSSVLAAPTLLLFGVPSASTGRGILLAVVSGAVTSGVGYAGWYSAMRGLTVTQAAVSQLSVPVIAAAGAVAFLEEPITSRFVLSGAAVLTGVGLVLSSRAGSRT